jgi:phenylpropionate dioxygenase-like ring-hydroxylating dioxygenase large terminal subunit
MDTGMAAPLDDAQLSAALRPFGRSRTLPAQAYTSAEVLAWERRHLFAGAWTCVGRRPAPEVTHWAATAGDVGILVVGERAFANVCRHRGHELLPDGGTATRGTIVCPYHGWGYRLDGSLASAGAMRGTPDFVPEEHGLVEVPARVWQGWVFVNAVGGAPPFPAYLGGLAGLVDPYRPEALRPGARHDYEVAANWKVIVENYHECYHCPSIHPELCQVSPPNSGDNWDLPGAWVGGSMTLRPHAETMSISGRSAGAFIDGAPRDTVRYVGLFPNLLISAHPDYVMTHRLTPLAPDRTRVECEWLVPQGVQDASYAVEFWDITNREDWAACESVQRGISSPHYRPGPLAPGEDAVYQWMTLIARCYTDPAGALAQATEKPPSAQPTEKPPSTKMV